MGYLRGNNQKIAVAVSCSKTVLIWLSSIADYGKRSAAFAVDLTTREAALAILTQSRERNTSPKEQHSFSDK